MIMGALSDALNRGTGAMGVESIHRGNPDDPDRATLHILVVQTPFGPLPLARLYGPDDSEALQALMLSFQPGEAQLDPLDSQPAPNSAVEIPSYMLDAFPVDQPAAWD